MKDLTSEVAPLIDVTPLLRNGNAATNGAQGGGDLQGFNGAVVEFYMGARTDSSVACKIQEADDAGFTVNAGDVATTDVVGGVNLQTLNASNTRARLGYIGKRRFLRGVMTQSGATTGATYGSELVRGFAVKQPTATP
ncbi:MAG TPA: hypothetical protein VNN08_02910 [Thermoanaerobaculia bacterium]|nr:hypothetical protein [Thermoanaerobaculia bacterium]